jgi:hypothetical protein
MMSHIKVHSLTTYHILLAGELHMELYALNAIYRFQQWFAHLPSSWLVGFPLP